jgi:hypothetical protein
LTFTIQSSGFNPDVKNRAFTSLVLPHLEYTSTVWDPYHKQDIQALEKVQRKGARFVTGKYSMLNDLNWQPLQIRRKNKRLIVFHKAVNQNSPVEIPDYVTQSTYSGTRSHSKAFIEYCLGLSHHRQVTSTTWIKAPKCVYTIKNNKNRNHCVCLGCQTL